MQSVCSCSVSHRTHLACLSSLGIKLYRRVCWHAIDFLQARNGQCKNRRVAAVRSHSPGERQTDRQTDELARPSSAVKTRNVWFGLWCVWLMTAASSVKRDRFMSAARAQTHLGSSQHVDWTSSCELSWRGRERDALARSASRSLPALL